MWTRQTQNNNEVACVCCLASHILWIKLAARVRCRSHIFDFFCCIVSNVSWTSNSNTTKPRVVYEYLTISLHAICRDPSSFPRPNIYTQVSYFFNRFISTPSYYLATCSSQSYARKPHLHPRAHCFCLLVTIPCTQTASASTSRPPSLFLSRQIDVGSQSFEVRFVPKDPDAGPRGEKDTCPFVTMSNIHHCIHHRIHHTTAPIHHTTQSHSACDCACS